MQFSEPDAAIPQPYPSAAFHLPPVAFAIQAPQPREVADAVSGRDRFDVGEIADKFEVHRDAILAASAENHDVGVADVPAKP
jgi:hypothetical protein